MIWPALLLYQVTKQAGAYDALRVGIAKFSRNELFIILALSWVFSSFLQGIAGFGAPVVVVVPLLITVGVRPIHAVAMGVTAHAWARFFGTLGVGWLATLQVANLEEVMRAAYGCALLLLIPTYLGGLFVVWLYGRWLAVRHAWPLVLILGTILGVGPGELPGPAPGGSAGGRQQDPPAAAPNPGRRLTAISWCCPSGAAAQRCASSQLRCGQGITSCCRELGRLWTSI